MGKSRDYTQMVRESETECGCADSTLATGKERGKSSQAVHFAQLLIELAARLLPTTPCRLGGAPMQSLADSREVIV